LHSMHDVVSDILANPAVPRNQKRARILEAARRYRDDTSYVMTVAQWKDMSEMMGVQNMGGPVSGFLAGFPEPTVERGAVMAGMDHSASGGMAGMQHGATASTPAPMAGMDHSRMPGMAADSSSAPSDEMMALHMKLLADPVIRARMMQDPEMRRMMTSMMDAMPVEHRHMMQQLISDQSAAEAARSTTPAKAARARKATTKAAVKQPVAKKPVAKAATKPAAKKPVAKKPPPKKDPMAGMDHSKHKM
ncbi:MAG: hypothetical protein M3365_01705, partial [Gemmatimonadota bacterium]|nr:hypothetical protein [Gemmatimonadota bacterium]